MIFQALEPFSALHLAVVSVAGCDDPTIVARTAEFGTAPETARHAWVWNALAPNYRQSQAPNPPNTFSGQFTLGRRPTCDIVFKDRAISSIHAVLKWTVRVSNASGADLISGSFPAETTVDIEASVTDQSTNGTFEDHQPLLKAVPHPLRPSAYSGGSTTVTFRSIDTSTYAPSGVFYLGKGPVNNAQPAFAWEFFLMATPTWSESIPPSLGGRPSGVPGANLEMPEITAVHFVRPYFSAAQSSITYQRTAEPVCGPMISSRKSAAAPPRTHTAPGGIISEPNAAAPGSAFAAQAAAAAAEESAARLKKIEALEKKCHELSEQVAAEKAAGERERQAHTKAMTKAREEDVKLRQEIVALSNRINELEEEKNRVQSQFLRQLQESKERLSGAEQRVEGLMAENAKVHGEYNRLLSQLEKAQEVCAPTFAQMSRLSHILGVNLEAPTALRAYSSEQHRHTHPYPNPNTNSRQAVQPPLTARELDPRPPTTSGSDSTTLEPPAGPGSFAGVIMGVPDQQDLAGDDSASSTDQEEGDGGDTTGHRAGGDDLATQPAGLGADDATDDNLPSDDRSSNKEEEPTEEVPPPAAPTAAAGDCDAALLGSDRKRKRHELEKNGSNSRSPEELENAPPSPTDSNREEPPLPDKEIVRNPVGPGRNLLMPESGSDSGNVSSDDAVAAKGQLQASDENVSAVGANPN